MATPVIWLPLNGDLRNIGSSGNSFTFSGTPGWKNDGKFGQSYDLSKRVSATCSALADTTIWSVCFWVRVDSNSSSTENWRDIIGFTDVSTGGSNGQFRFECTYGSSPRAVSWHDNATNATVNGSVTIVSNKDEWHHCCVTVGSTKIRTYRDGTLINEGYAPAGGHLSGAFWLGETVGIWGSLNDVRIYNEELSQKEVKEIAQGLILHYRLDGNGWGQENELPAGVHAAVTSTNSFEFAGWVYNFYPKTWLNEHLISGQQYILSYKVTCLTIPDSSYTYKENRPSPILVHQGSGWNQTVIVDDGVKSTNMVVGQVKRYTHIFTFTPDTDTSHPEYYGLCGYTALYRNASNATAYATFRIDNLKLEKGSVATPWCPNSADPIAATLNYNTAIENDISGYNNNGIKNNITVVADSPRYLCSSNFNGTDSYVKVNTNSWMSQASEALTINLWAKATTWPTNGGRLISCTETGGFNLEAGNSGYWRFPVHVYTASDRSTTAYKYDSNEIQISALTPNEWNMITLVYDTTGTKTYINGELHHTYTNTSYGIHFNTNARLFLGCEAAAANASTPYFPGNISDFRLYMTALVEEDIKKLYNTGMSIDNLQRLHAYEFVENEIANPKFYKNGIVEVKEFIEQDNTSSNYTDKIIMDELIEI